MLIESTPQTARVISHDVMEYVEAVAAAVKSHPNPSEHVRVDWWRDSRFIGRTFASLSDLMAKTWQPWPEGVALVDSMVDELKACDIMKPVSRLRVRRWSEDTGDEMDLCRLRSGSPFWQESRRKVRSAPAVVSVVVNVATAYGYTARQAGWRGAAAVALAHLLESAGYRCDMWVMFAIAGGRFNGCSRRCATAINVKRAQDPLDINAAASAMSAWFFRAWMIPDAHLFHRLRPSDTGGYSGSVQDEFSDKTKMLDAVIPPGRRIVIENAWTREAALSSVRRVLDVLETRSKEMLSQ